MVGIIKIINGQKKIVPLTADAGAGNPVGTIIVVCTNRVPSNYLPLGTQFDTTQYPLLYEELGTDTTPTAASLNLPTLSSGQYVIKATSGLTEGQQDDVANLMNEQRSYSTEEHLTGRKWIDGKPIYRKTVDCGAMPNNTTKNVAHSITNLDEVITLSGNAKRSEGTRLPLPFTSADNLTNNIQVYSNDTNIVIIAGTNRSNYSGYVTLEYTKTTD